MKYTENTRLADILADHPWLSEELPKKDQRFAVMNTFAGKLMLKKFTVADVSKTAGIPVSELLQELDEMIGRIEGK